MNEITLAERSFQLIRKDFGFRDELDFQNGEDPWTLLHAFLVQRVDYLLDNDFNALLNALYRIDIPQEKVTELLYHSESGTISSALASAIIDREKQKVVTRLKYRNQ